MKRVFDFNRIFGFWSFLVVGIMVMVYNRDSSMFYVGVLILLLREILKEWDRK